MGTYEKPQWIIDINGGFLPILELPNGELLYESKLIMDYLEEEFPETDGYSLLPTTPLERCKMKMLISRLVDPMLPLIMKMADKSGPSDKDIYGL
jgi:glutathione S-transferase